MKPLKSPAYVQKRTQMHATQVDGDPLCPLCGRLAKTRCTKKDGGNIATQYRYCECGGTCKTTFRIQ